MSVIDPIRAAEDRNVQLERRLAEARRSIAADQQLIVLLQAEKARRDPLYFAARAFCAWFYTEGRDGLIGARLQHLMMRAHRETTPEREDEESDQ